MPKAARAWTRHMEAHRIQKEYIAVVRGKLLPKEGTIDMPIGRQGGDIRVRQWVNVPGAVPAVTKYRVITHFWGQSQEASGTILLLRAKKSIVRVFPQTGRLHQIRVHFAAIGHPSIGRSALYTVKGKFMKDGVGHRLHADDRASLGFSSRCASRGGAHVSAPDDSERTSRRCSAA